MYSRFAQVLNQDIYKIIKKRICIKKGEMPLLYKIQQKMQIKEKMLHEDHCEEKSRSRDAPSKALKSKFGTSSALRSNSFKKVISRMRSRAVQLKETRSITSKRRTQELEKSVYSEPEEEDDTIDFATWTNLLQNYFTKEATYEMFPLKEISKLRQKMLRRSKAILRYASISNL